LQRTDPRDAKLGSTACARCRRECFGRAPLPAFSATAPRRSQVVPSTGLRGVCLHGTDTTACTAVRLSCDTSVICFISIHQFSPADSWMPTQSTAVVEVVTVRRSARAVPSSPCVLKHQMNMVPRYCCLDSPNLQSSRRRVTHLPTLSHSTLPNNCFLRTLGLRGRRRQPPSPHLPSTTSIKT
jgi:hypothetical protein